MPHRTEQADSVEPGPQLFAAFLADRGTRSPLVRPLTKLLAHESIVTSQRYVTAAGTETRTDAAQTRSTTC